MNERYFKLYCFVIALIITVPLVGTLVNYSSRLIWNRNLLQEPELIGVTEIPKRPQLSLETLQSGQFQTDFEEYFEYNLFSRKVLTKVYNQLLYSVFNSTDNREILVGCENYFFEKAYPTALLTELTPQERAGLEENINKLARLTRLLKERGVVLIVRMSPSKAELYPEYLPPAYSRFVIMQQNGEYTQNWYQAFKDLIAETDIPCYDRHDLMQKLKNEGEIVFTKGGTHWSLSPMAEYINGLNAYLEVLLNKKLSIMVVTDEQVITGKMGIPDDSDIWRIGWNALWAEPNYPSPNITFSTIPGEDSLRVFTVGRSFTTVLLSVIYSVEHPVWDETYFSWYNGRVLKFPSEVPSGTQISDKTDDYEEYLKMDVIMIEFLENGTGWTQFEFVENMLQYLEGNGAES
jgi:hypothetical protein